MTPYPKPFGPKRSKRQASRIGKTGAKSLRKSPYLHPAWVALRNKVLRRAKDRCEMPDCRGTARATQVHHARYSTGSGWRRLIVPMKHLYAICPDCHARQHPRRLLIKGGKSLPF